MEYVVFLVGGQCVYCKGLGCYVRLCELWWVEELYCVFSVVGIVRS